MIENQLKSAWRHFRKNSLQSFINVAGLSLGLVSFILIALYVYDELTFDRMHRQADHIYRVVEERSTNNQPTKRVAAVPFQLSEQLPAALPEVKQAFRFTALGRLNVTDPETNRTFYEDMVIANPAFFNMFDFRLISGNRATALTEPNSVVITEGTALKYFGTKEALGKVLMTDRDSLPFRVTAVMENFPSNSHLQGNLIFSESSMRGEGYRKFVANDWSSNYYSTYLLLSGEPDVTQLEKRINRLMAEHREMPAATSSRYYLQPLTAIHFHSAGIEGGGGSNGNIMYVYVFSLVGLLILLIACINYINISTARFTKRAREIAVRKVTGATRGNLVGQFLSESAFISLISFAVAFGMVLLLLPGFNQFAGKTLSLTGGSDYRIWWGLAFTLCLVSLLSGLYPALFLSKWKPFQLLKGKLRMGSSPLNLRKGLVVFQFSICIIMIIATLVVYRQIRYVDTADMGFKKDQLLVIDINSGKVRRSADAIKTEYARLPTVSSVSVSSRVPGEWKNLPQVVCQTAGSTKTPEEMYFIGADENFLSTYKIQLLSGGGFTGNRPVDSASVMLNETAARMLGITSARDQWLEIPAIDISGNPEPLEQTYRVRVAGIVKDFNFQSLREKIAPMIIGYRNNPVQSIDYFTVRLQTKDAKATIDKLTAIMENVDKQQLFEYHFLDDQWALFYAEDQKRQVIFLAVALLSIFIACLGLFGLTSFEAQQRTKEIGIRKVLGASVGGVVSMLSTDILKPVFVATLVAFPVAWWAMHRWLQDFAYRISLSWWIFAVAALMALGIALLTVCYQAIKAALANPVSSLRSE